MKKYRITSIPQSLPKAQTGLSINLNKFFKKKKPFVDPYEGSTLPSSSRTVNRPLGFINKYDFTGLDEDYKKLVLAQEKIEQQNQIEQQELYDQKKAADLADWDIEYQEIQKQDALRQEEQNRINNYYKGLYDSKKSDKIEPLHKNKKFTQEQVDEIKNKGEYYVQKNNDDTYSLWPNEALYIKIIDNGFKDRDFKKLWGLDGEQVREQLGELIDEREMSYDESMLHKITKTALDENKTPEEVINELPSKYGITKNMQSEFQPKVSKDLNKKYDDYVSGVMENYDDEKAKLKEEYNSNENNFDFGNVSGYETIDDQEIWRIATDEDKKYQDWWVNQGKTSEEKAERRKQLKDIDDPTTYTASQESIKQDRDHYLSNANEADEFSRNEMEKQMSGSGNDRFQGMNYNLFERAQYVSDYTGADIKGQIEGAEEELTKKDASLVNYMSKNISGIKADERNAFKHQFTNPDLTEADKINIMSNLINDVEDPLTTKEGVPITDFSKYSDMYNSIYSYDALNNHRWGLQDLDKAEPAPINNRTVLSDLWDVAVNPGDAIGYAMDLRPGATMWKGSGGRTYNEQQAYDKNRGRENRDGSITMNSDRYTHSVNPVSMMANLYNTVNPLKWTDKLSKDFSLDTVSELGSDAALAMATIYSGGLAVPIKGAATGSRLLNAANKLKKVNKFTTGVNKLGKKFDKFIQPTWGSWNKGMSVPKNLMNDYKNIVKSPLRWSGRRLDDARTFGQIASMPFRAAPNYAKNWIRDSWKYEKPFFMYETVKPDGYAHNLIKKVYDSGLDIGNNFNSENGLNALMTASMISPALRGLSKGFQLGKGLGRGLINKNLAIMNPTSKYSFTAGNPKTGKGFFYGNSETLPNKFNNHFAEEYNAFTDPYKFKSSGNWEHVGSKGKGLTPLVDDLLLKESMMNDIEIGESLIPKTRDKIFNKTGLGIDFRRHKKSKKRYDLGGMVVNLSQKEIDQYAKEGWIIEDV